MIQKPIWGIHDITDMEGLPIEPHIGGSWATVSVSLTNDKPEYYEQAVRQFVDNGFTVLMRLNWGYHPTGTIPSMSQSPTFIDRCRAWAETFSRVNHFIIGNEPNLTIERPNSQIIRAGTYAYMFNRVRPAIKGVRPDADIITAAIGPWNRETGDWLGYFETVLDLVECDGIAIHSYSRGYDPKAVRAETYMDTLGYADRYSGFLAYRDFIERIPIDKNHLPIYMTEVNGNEPWKHYKPGWMQEVVTEIAQWNDTKNQQIECVCFYRAGYDDGYLWTDKAKEDYMKLYMPQISNTIPSKPKPDKPSETPKIIMPFNREYPITQHFVGRYDYYKKYGSMIGHNGVDFGVPVGTPIQASWKGIAVEHGNWEDTWGNYLKVRHPDLGLELLYAHLQREPSEWDIGGKFPQGEILAWTGNTGDSSGPHLHLSVRLIDRHGNYISTPANPRGYVDPLIEIKRINDQIEEGKL